MPEFYHADFYVVKSDDKGRGLFTSRSFVEGEKLYLLDYWSEEVMPMHLTNHSCDPNSEFNEAGELIALRDIEKDEEVSYDYLLRPLPASPWNFDCQCLADDCKGWVSALSETANNFDIG